MPLAGTVLEEYAFKVVARYIHLANAEDQTRLIELVKQLDQTLDAGAEPIDTQSDSCLSKLQQEWKGALNKRK